MSPKFSAIALLLRPNFHLRRIARAIEESNRIAKERLLWEQKVHSEQGSRPPSPRVVALEYADDEERNKTFREENDYKEEEADWV